MKKLIILIISCIMSQSLIAASVDIAVMSPMEVEATAFTKKMSNVKAITINHQKYYIGLIDGKTVVQVISGIGKVNATIAAVHVIENFHPKVLLLEGTAGAISDKLDIGSIVVGKQVYALERDKLNFSGKNEANPPELQALPCLFVASESLLVKLNKINDKAYDVRLGVIATSDRLPGTPMDILELKNDRADVVEMEGAAVMQVCWIYKIPCLVIRSNSNVTIKKSDEPVFTQENLNISIANAADYTRRVIQAL